MDWTLEDTKIVSGFRGFGGEEKFEKENRRIKMQWFKYDTITAVFTIITFLIGQKYKARWF